MFVDFTKTQKSRYLKSETLLINLQIKKFIDFPSRTTLWQKNSFVAGLRFNDVEEAHETPVQSRKQKLVKT